MAQCPAREFVGEGFTRNEDGRCCTIVEIQARCSRVVFRAFRFGIELDHARFVDCSLELAKRGDRWRGKSEPEEKYRLVARKKLLIVLQCDEIVFRNLCVSGISVFYVERTILESGVAKRVINANHILWI